jgi:hypothetical protein
MPLVAYVAVKRRALFDDIGADRVGGLLVNALHLAGESPGILHLENLEALFLQEGDVRLQAVKDRRGLGVERGLRGGANAVAIFGRELVHEFFRDNQQFDKAVVVGERQIFGDLIQLEVDHVGQRGTGAVDQIRLQRRIQGIDGDDSRDSSECQDGVARDLGCLASHLEPAISDGVLIGRRPSYMLLRLANVRFCERPCSSR